MAKFYTWGHILIRRSPGINSAPLVKSFCFKVSFSVVHAYMCSENTAIPLLHYPILVLHVLGGSTVNVTSMYIRPYLFDLMLCRPDWLLEWNNFENHMCRSRDGLTPLCYKIVFIEDHPMLLSCTDTNRIALLEIYFQT